MILDNKNNYFITKMNDKIFFYTVMNASKVSAEF